MKTAQMFALDPANFPSRAVYFLNLARTLRAATARRKAQQEEENQNVK